MGEQRYAGFWIRVLATFIDTIVVLLLLIPFMMLFGLDESTEIFSIADILINLGIIILTIVLWIYLGATPGKMATKIKIVDEKTGQNLSIGQSIIRYIGYIIGTIPFMLGFFWISFDKKKQGWHDKMASSIVIYTD